ncbi:unnamed protein product [Agarophyton chilense]
MLRTLAIRASTPSLRRFASQIREPGPVGLSAGDDPRATLVKLYKQTLDAVNEIPETAKYRANVEKITNYRMGIISENQDINKIEKTLNVGQIEEVIEQAEDELQLIPRMIEWKPWEMKDGEKPVVITVID